MATLADELLNDFEDSGSDVDEQNQNKSFGNDGQNTEDDAPRNSRSGSTPGMELDGDEEELPDAEGDFAAHTNSTELKDAPDQEETKARVEKMKLRGVSDVRNVAGLMKTLQPVLEVRSLLTLHVCIGDIAFTSLSYSNPDVPPSSAENRTLSIYPAREEGYYSWLYRR